MRPYFLSGFKVLHNGVSDTDALPTIAIHGACATGQIWQHIGKQFAQRKQPLFALTLPGHYEPIDNRLGKHTLSVYAGAVSRFIREEIIGECHILAHSMGGLVAQLLDPSVNAQVKRRVLVSAVPAGKPLISPALGLRAVKYLPAIIFGRPWKYTRRDYMELLCNELDDSFAESLYVASVKESGWAAQQMLTGRTLVQNITGEIHVLCAGQDLIVPPQLQRKMVNMYPSVSFLGFEGGHMSLFEPDSPIVDEILTRLYPPR